MPNPKNETPRSSGADIEAGKKRIAAIIAAAKPFPPLELPEPEKPARVRKPRKAKKDSDSSSSSSEAVGQGDEIPPPDGASPGPDDPAYYEHVPDDRGPPADAGGDWDRGAPLPPETIEKCAGLPLNDVGNGKRLLYWFGDQILHVREVGWHWWTGTHWSKDGGEEKVQRYAQLTAARIKMERDALGFTRYEQAAVEAAEAAENDLAKVKAEFMKRDKKEAQAEIERLSVIISRGSIAAAALEKRKDKRATFSISSGNSNRINGMIAQAIPQTIGGKPVSVDPSELDSDPHAFNVQNGTLRFCRELDLECPEPDVVRFKWSVRCDDHDRGDHITKCAPVNYDPDTDCPKWMTFLKRVQPDEVMREFLRDFHGYGLTGLTGMQAFLFHHGEGANGKSTFIEALMRLVGAYGDTLNPESFMAAQIQKSGGQANPDLADLPGVRLLRVSELPDRAKLQENLVKALTGGEPMKVRHNYAKRFFLFTPVFKASMSGNSKPNIHDISEGFWRRIHMVPWDVQIPKTERREFEEMQAEFASEYAGILNWLIEGCLAYLHAGRLYPPDRVAAATGEHRDDMDPIGQFLDACVVRREGWKVTGGDLYAVYEAWCAESGMKPFQQTTFGMAVPKHGWMKIKEGVVKYVDMALSHDAPDPPPSYGALKSPRAPQEET